MPPSIFMVNTEPLMWEIPIQTLPPTLRHWAAWKENFIRKSAPARTVLLMWEAIFCLTQTTRMTYAFLCRKVSIMNTKTPSRQSFWVSKSRMFLRNNLIFSLPAPEKQRDRPRTGVAADGRADREDLHLSIQLRKPLLHKSRHFPCVLHAFGLA